MRHLDDEDIAGLIDGTIDEKDREIFLKHLSRCNECFTVYSETLKFVEEEKAEKKPEKVTVPGFWERLVTIVPKPVLLPAAALLVIAVAIGIYLFIQPPGNGILKARVEYITQSIDTFYNHYGLSPLNDKNSAAVRAGLIVEDLRVLADTGESETHDTLKKSLIEGLRSEMNTISGHAPDTGNIDRVIKTVERDIAAASLSPLYDLGRFIERSAMDTFENKPPAKEEMDKFISVAAEHGLPGGLIDRLRKVMSAAGAVEEREIWNEIKEILWVTE